MSEEVKQYDYEMFDFSMDLTKGTYKAVVRDKETGRDAEIIGYLPDEVYLDEILKGKIEYLIEPPKEAPKTNAESSDTRTVSAEDYEFLQEMKAMAAKKYILVPIETVDLISKLEYKYLDKILNKE